MTQRLEKLPILLMTTVGCVLVGGLGYFIAEATNRVSYGDLYFWLFVLLLVAGSSAYLIARSPPRVLDIGRMYAVPTLITITAASLLTHGVTEFLGPGGRNHGVRETSVGGVQPHQLAWGSLGVIFLLIAVRHRVRLPLWLIAYASLGVLLGLAGQFALGPVLDVGLSAIGLFVMWVVANALQEDGGIVRLLHVFAIGYWMVTILAVVVHFTHLSLWSMTPASIQLPWEGSLKNVLTTGDDVGYGFITGQPGREASFIVCAYYLVLWRYHHRSVHGLLGLLAFGLFLTGYGRVPVVGGVIGFGIILLTNQSGTRFWRVAFTALLVAALLPTLASKFSDLSARPGHGQYASTTDGHLSIWSQHLGLFLQEPLTGVGSNATATQTAEARLEPILHESHPLPPEALNKEGSRGPGGWTGLLAQRGVVNGGIILGLIVLALAYCFSPFPDSSAGQKDITLARALILAWLIFCITDVAPFSIYTVTAYVLGQVTMIAAVRAIRRTTLLGRFRDP
jgi:hypothetical protein